MEVFQQRPDHCHRGEVGKANAGRDGRRHLLPGQGKQHQASGGEQTHLHQGQGIDPQQSHQRDPQQRQQIEVLAAVQITQLGQLPLQLHRRRQLRGEGAFKKAPLAPRPELLQEQPLVKTGG